MVPAGRRVCLVRAEGHRQSAPSLLSEESDPRSPAHPEPRSLCPVMAQFSSPLSDPGPGVGAVGGGQVPLALLLVLPHAECS